MGEFCRAETDGHLMIVTIDRPEVYNALHPMASQELSDVFDEFAESPDLWVAILTGAGDKAFCAGNDLKYHAELRAKTGERPVHPPQGFGGITKRFDLDKPVIAAVNALSRAPWELTWSRPRLCHHYWRRFGSIWRLNYMFVITFSISGNDRRDDGAAQNGGQDSMIWKP